jgi:hypothetical protein
MGDIWPAQGAKVLENLVCGCRVADQHQSRRGTILNAFYNFVARTCAIGNSAAAAGLRSYSGKKLITER